MIQQHGRGLTGLRWLGTAVFGTAVVGCGGWVDLQTSGGGGSSAGAAGDMAVGGSQGSPDDGRGASQAGGSGAGGDPTSPGGSSAVPRFVALSAPEPQHWPDGVARADLTWSGTSSIDAGNLEEGALVGTMTYCFKRPLAGESCDYTTSELFVWTEAAGMVPLHDLGGVDEPAANTFYASYVSADGATVVGSFTGEPGQGGTLGFFRWTKEGGAVSLGEPPDTDSGGPSFVSKDGKVIAGVVKRMKADTSQFIWTETGGFQLLDSALGWPANGEIVAISEDGTTLLAETMGVEPRQIYRWTIETGAESLVALPGLPSCSFGRGVADLTTLFGTCFDPTDYVTPGVAFRWTAADGMVRLTEQGTGVACQMRVISIAANGASAIGTARCGTDAEQHWAKWSAAAGVTLLAEEAPPFEISGVSEDATVLFGTFSDGGNPNGRAFTWDGGPAIAELAGLATTDSTWIFDSNAGGTIFAGQSGVPNYPGTAVLWDASGIVDVGAELTASGVSLEGVELQGAARVASRDGVTLVQGVANSRESRGVWFAWLSTP